MNRVSSPQTTKTTETTKLHSTSSNTAGPTREELQAMNDINRNSFPRSGGSRSSKSPTDVYLIHQVQQLREDKSSYLPSSPDEGGNVDYSTFSAPSAMPIGGINQQGSTDASAPNSSNESDSFEFCTIL